MTFHTADLFPAFRGTEVDQSVPLALAISQVILIQNNRCAKLAYFGMAYLTPLPYSMEDHTSPTTSVESNVGFFPIKGF